MNKRSLRHLLAAWLVLVVLFFNTALVQAEQPPLRITLLQVNDVYQISPVDKGKRGGMARMATLVNRVRAENPHTFFVLGGDTISPSIASRIFQGRQMIDLWNQVGLDVAVLGNHEFDFGPEVLKARMAESQFIWVNSNVIDLKTRKPFGNSTPFVIKDVEGVKIGFFGLLTPDTENASHPGDNVAFADPLPAATNVVKQMKKAGADVIVAVTHLPMNQDKELGRKLGTRHLAAIMGGHEHTLLTAMAGGVPIFKVASDARNLGRIDLWVDRATKKVDSTDWELIPVTAEIPEDPAIAAAVKTYEDQINAELGQPIGSTAVELDALQKTNRGRETNLGNFVADTYRSRLNADIALINGGNIRSNTTYGPGPLTRRDVLTILPFGNQVVKVEVTGAQVKAALENGVSRLNDEEAGRFPQVSGLTFSYDPAKPAGSRVVDVRVDGRPLDPARAYTLATSAYLVGGGDDYAMLKGARYVITPEEAPLESDIIMEAIRAADTIAPRVEGRITRLGGN